MANITLPSISSQGSLQKYLKSIRKFPILEIEEEYTLARMWKNKKDLNAAHKLVTSHLRLVAKIAMGYKGYGLPVADLISEGNILNNFFKSVELFKSILFIINLSK